MTRQETLSFIRLGYNQLLKHTIIDKETIVLMKELNDA